MVVEGPADTRKAVAGTDNPRGGGVEVVEVEGGGGGGGVEVVEVEWAEVEGVEVEWVEVVEVEWVEVEGVELEVEWVEAVSYTHLTLPTRSTV